MSGPKNVRRPLRSSETTTALPSRPPSGWKWGTKTDPVFVSVRLTGGYSTILPSDILPLTSKQLCKEKVLTSVRSLRGISGADRKRGRISRLYSVKDNFIVLTEHSAADPRVGRGMIYIPVFYRRNPPSTCQVRRMSGVPFGAVKQLQHFHPDHRRDGSGEQKRIPFLFRYIYRADVRRFCPRICLAHIETTLQRESLGFTALFAGHLRRRPKTGTAEVGVGAPDDPLHRSKGGLRHSSHEHRSVTEGVRLIHSASCKGDLRILYREKTE